MREPKRTMDQIIQEAQAEGKFDNLEGMGKPLVLDPSPDAVIQNLLKEAGVKPDWIEAEVAVDKVLAEAEALLARFEAEADVLRRRLLAPPPPAPEADTPARAAWSARLLARLAPGPAPVLVTLADEVATYHRRWETRLEQYAALLHRANTLIRRFNLIVPIVQRQRAPIYVSDRLEAFAGRFPCYERGPEGALREVRGVVPSRLLEPPKEESADAAGKRDLRQAAAMYQVRRFGRRPPPIG